jgi:hypothetical protein
MSPDLPDVVVYPFGMAVGVLMIVGTLLHRAGISSFIRPRGFKKRPVPVGAFLLQGAGMVLFSGVQVIPTDHQRIWALVLDPVVICIFIAGLVLLMWKPVIPASRDR